MPPLCRRVNAQGEGGGTSEYCYVCGACVDLIRILYTYKIWPISFKASVCVYLIVLSELLVFNRLSEYCYVCGAYVNLRRILYIYLYKIWPISFNASVCVYLIVLSEL